MQEILNTNCLDYMKTVSDNYFTMTLTDIPYSEVNRKSSGLRNLNKGNADIKTFELEPFMKEVIRVTNGSIYIFCGITQISEIDLIFREHGLSERVLTWEKTNPSPMNCDKLFLSSLEFCVFGRKPKATFNGTYVHNYIKLKTERSKIHPTQKPVELFKKLIELSSNENDIIYDPCAGSGTTGIACQELNRQFVLNEIDETFFSSAKERLKL